MIDSMVEDVITPIIAAIGGQPNFQSLTLDIGDGEIRYGSFLNRSSRSSSSDWCCS